MTIPRFLAPLCTIFALTLQAASPTGLIPDQSVDTKMFATPRQYFEGKIPQQVYKAYRDGKSPKDWEDNGLPPEECVSLPAGSTTCVVYVPAGYDGTSPFGVYLHVSPSARGHSPSEDWQRLMDKLSLIYVSAHDTANATPMWRRVANSMDSLATVKKHYRIDEKRVYAGGLSGGGHMSFMCMMLYPQFFQGVVSHAAQGYLPYDKQNAGHYPGLDPSDVRTAPRRERKWVVISGDKDFNYAEIKSTSANWTKAGFAYRFLDVPGMGHNNASAPALEEALTWMGAAKVAARPPGVAPATKAPSANGPAPALVGVPRTWTSSKGEKLEGTLLQVKGEMVLLRLADGRNRTFRLDAFGPEDRVLLAPPAASP